MSVGGPVVEVVDTGERVWICTRDHPYKTTTAIYVERTAAALAVSIGDMVWWQGEWAFWTPYGDNGRSIGPCDVKLKRIGCSGVGHPAVKALMEEA